MTAILWADAHDHSASPRVRTARLCSREQHLHLHRRLRPSWTSTPSPTRSATDGGRQCDGDGDHLNRRRLASPDTQLHHSAQPLEIAGLANDIDARTATACGQFHDPGRALGGTITGGDREVTYIPCVDVRR